MRFFRNKLCVVINKGLWSFAFLACGLILAGCIPHLGSGAPTYNAGGEFVQGRFANGFPAVPVYKNSKVVESYAEQKGMGAMLISPDSLAKVIAFYQDSFTPLGWDATFHKKDDKSYYYDIKNKDFTGQVLINVAADNRQTAITVTVSSRQ